MKRSVCILLTLLFLMLCPSTAGAQQFGENGFESLPLSPEFEEISALETEILTDANLVAQEQFGAEQPFFDREDLDWEKAYKFYLECNPYELGADSADEILAALSREAGELWVVPLTKEGRWITVTLSVSSPPTEDVQDVLTPEEFYRLEQQAGSWVINSVGICEEPQDDPDQVDALLREKGYPCDCQKILLGGFSKMRSATALTLRGGKMEYAVIFREPWILGSSKPFTFGSAKASNIQKGAVLPFEQMCSIMDRMDPPSRPPGTPLIAGVLAGAAALFALALWVIWKMTRRPRG